MGRTDRTLRFGQIGKSLWGSLPWKGVLAIAAGGALLLATLLAAAGLFLLLLPVFAVAGVVARLLYGRRRRATPGNRPAVIEGRYEVVAAPGDPAPGRGWDAR